MSYQAEERYWTDYLRIALPIAGLLLLLGVFWYWASSFIGDDNDNPPQTPEAAVVTTPITAITPTHTVTTAVTLTVQTVEPTEPAAAADEPTEEPDVEPTAAPDGEEQPEPNDVVFAQGDLVVINDVDVNMREEPSLEAEIVDTLELGAELEVLSSEPVEADGYVWWNVVEVINEIQGWVAGDLIDPL